MQKTLVFLLFLLVSNSAYAFEIAGRKVYCQNMELSFANIPIEGINTGEGEIVLSRYLLPKLKPVVQWFVFYHECGHNHVGGNELGADCWGINMGVKEGWLTEPDLPAICASWHGAPATDTHPSAVRRCQNIYRCFKGITAKLVSKKKDVQNGFRTPSSPHN